MNTEKSLRVMLAGPPDAARVLLLAILKAAPQMLVTGVAIGSLEIVEAARVQRPDVVLLHVGSASTDGIKATRRIMETEPVPIIVVTANIRPDSVAGTLNALSAGALAVLKLPAEARAPGYAAECRHFIAMIRSLASVRVIRRISPPGVPETPVSVAPPPPGLPNIKVVAIAASTGGPAALRRVLYGLPGSFPVPILVVQHIADGFSAGLVRWLNEAASVCVKLAEHGEPFVAGNAYLAPDRLHLGVSRNACIVLSDEAPVGGFKPSATFLFESVAEMFGHTAMAVIMTGMGEDGFPGLQAVKSAGGYVLAQDEKSCVVFGMPARAVSTGLADEVAPLEALGACMMRCVSRG